MQHLVSIQLAVSYQHSCVLSYQSVLLYQHGFHIVMELMNSEPCNRTLQ